MHPLLYHSAENDSVNRRLRRVESAHFYSTVANWGHAFSERAYAKTINKSSGKKKEDDEHSSDADVPMEKLG
jgi:hypothetical protein